METRGGLAALAFVLKPVISGASSRGSALQKRLRDREKEMEADERDRKREKEELEEIRQRLLDEGHPNPDAELRRVRLSKITVCVSLCERALSSYLLCSSAINVLGVCCLSEGHLSFCISLIFLCSTP